MDVNLEQYHYVGEKPKPDINLSWYKGTDEYSEGEIEDYIIELLATNPGRDYSKILNEHPSWSTLYHLAPARQNIINWYPFTPESDVLEIGCGMGAITETLCDKCNNVTAVELSKKRATATLMRCREKENLNIIVGNLNDIEFERQFDYITLIGVLEYQKTYTDSETPFIDFLKKIKSLLKPNGKLLIAIENKYGLKYWCGAREDHSSIPFDGINQYGLAKGNAQTFSKEELKQMLVQSGFESTYFYYPLPDYKLPSVIYSEKSLPKSEKLENMLPYYGGRAASTMVANEMEIYKDIIENHVFEFFANSFLVECAPSAENLGKVKFALGGTIRQPEYRIMTTFCDKEVIKESLAENSAHIREIYQNSMELERRGLHIVGCKLQESKLVLPYMNLPLVTEYFLEAYEKKNIIDIWTLWDYLFKQIKDSSEEEHGSSVLQDLGLVTEFCVAEGDKLLKKGYTDMLYRNCFVDQEENWLWFDQEWSLEKVPASYILFCNVWELYLSYPWMEQLIGLDRVLERYQVLEYKEAYMRLRGLFQKSICDNDYISAYTRFAGVNRNTIIQNINTLLSNQG